MKQMGDRWKGSDAQEKRMQKYSNYEIYTISLVTSGPPFASSASHGSLLQVLFQRIPWLPSLTAHPMAPFSFSASHGSPLLHM